MDKFEDLSQPANLFVLPRQVEVTYEINHTKSATYTKRKCENVDYSKEEKHQLDLVLAKVSQNCDTT